VPAGKAASQSSVLLSNFFAKKKTETEEISTVNKTLKLFLKAILLY
jgi:hypothetical protein